MLGADDKPPEVRRLLEEGKKHGREVHGSTAQIYDDCDECIRICSEIMEARGVNPKEYVDHAKPQFRSTVRAVIAYREKYSHGPSEWD